MAQLTIPSKAVHIPLIKKPVPMVAILVVGGIAIAGGYYAYRKGYLDSIISKITGEEDTAPGLDAPLSAGPAAGVSFDLQPDSVKPNSYTTISGEFTGPDGSPVTVRNAMYYVFEDSLPRGRTLKTQGSLGALVSRFSQNIPTLNFRDGQYTIVVTDVPLSPQEIGPMNLGPGPMGVNATRGPQTSMPGAGMMTIS